MHSYYTMALNKNDIAVCGSAMCSLFEIIPTYVGKTLTLKQCGVTAPKPCLTMSRLSFDNTGND